MAYDYFGRNWVIILTSRRTMKFCSKFWLRLQLWLSV